MARPLVAEINLTAVRNNYQLALNQSITSTVLAVVKANAYGHGAIAVSQALADIAPAFAVACIEEAEQLVVAGIKKPIVLLEGFFESDELPIIIAKAYEPVIHSYWQLNELVSYLKTHPVADNSLNVWLKVDTGMHRLGFAVEEAESAYKIIKALPAINTITLTSHFACADDLSSAATAQQLAKFETLQQQLNCPVSIANSSATLGWSEAQHGYLRAGIMLYGASPFMSHNGLGEQLQTVMTLKSQLISVRDLPGEESVGYGARYITSKPTRIGVVACGYGDGYPRHAKDGTPMLVNGKKCYLAGRVSMDMLTVDLTGSPDAKIGDEVILWGEGLPVNEVANYCDTISYTLLTGLLPRVPRRYIKDEELEIVDVCL